MSVNEQEVAIAANQFVATRPDFAEYNIPVNTQAMATRIIETWGEVGLENVSCWEIVFVEMKTMLMKNPDYVSPEFKKRANSMSVDEMKRAYRNEPGFANNWERLSRAEIPPEAISSDPWVGLTATKYNGLDEPARQRLYATDFNFRKNVERLVREGALNAQD